MTTTAAVSTAPVDAVEPPQDADAVMADLLARTHEGPLKEEYENQLAIVVAAVNGDVPFRVAFPSDGKALAESALDGRSDTKTKPIYIAHGRDSYDMGGFANMRNYMINTYGFSGGVHRLGYYGGECNVEFRAEHHGDHNKHYGGSGEHSSKTGCIGGNNQVHDLGTNIEHLAYHVAWSIYDHFTVSGTVLDYNGHSMGGLLIRYAMAKQGATDFPPHLLVEDVATMGTPHGGLGTSWCWWSPWSDVRQMCSNAAFMQYLDANAQNPQGQQWSTDWTVIGSDCDGWVAWNLAVDMSAAHKVVYMNPCHGHSDYYGDTSGASDATVDYMDAPSTTWYHWTSAPHTVRWVSHANYYGSW